MRMLAAFAAIVVLAPAVAVSAAPPPGGPHFVAGYSYGSSVSPSGTVYVSEPSVWVLVEPDPGTATPTATLTVDGNTYPMTYDPALDIVIYTFTAPIAPGTSETGEVVLSDAGYRTVTLPVSFTIATTPQTLPAETLSSWKVLAEINLIRTTEGLSALAYDAALSAAAQAHAAYYVRNQALYAPGTMSLHQEETGTPGFTGVEPWQRDQAFAATYPTTAEVMAVGEGGLLRSLLALYDTTFHRFGLLSESYTAAGPGYVPAAASAPDALVADLGGPDISPQNAPAALLFPWQGATGVPTSYAGEDPNPIAAYRSNDQLTSDPAGYPVTVTFTSPNVTGVTVSQATLTAAGGNDVPTWVVDGANYTDQNPLYPGESMGNSVALFAQQALSPGTTYTALIAGTLALADGSQQAFSQSWSFTTIPAPKVTRAFVFGDTLYLQGENLAQAQVQTPTQPTSTSAAYPLVAETFAAPPAFTSVRVAGTSIPLAPPPFIDLAQAPWADTYIASADATGLMVGMGHSTFAPQDPLTGEEALTAIWRSLGRPSAPADQSASSVPAWAVAAVDWAASVGLVTNADIPALASPAPRADVTRWLLAANGIGAAGTPSFADASQIPPIDAGFVAKAQALGIIVGFPDGTFRPLEPISRAQMAKILDLLALPAHL